MLEFFPITMWGAESDGLSFCITRNRDDGVFFVTVNRVEGGMLHPLGEFATFGAAKQACQDAADRRVKR